MTFELGKKRAGFGILGTVIIVLLVLFFLGYIIR
jgi:hypothetical protein